MRKKNLLIKYQGASEASQRSFPRKKKYEIGSSTALESFHKLKSHTNDTFIEIDQPADQLLSDRKNDKIFQINPILAHPANKKRGNQRK